MLYLTVVGMTPGGSGTLHTLCNPKAHFCAENSLSLVPLLSHINAVHSLHSVVSFKINLILPFHLHPGLSSGLLLKVYSSQLYAFLFPHQNATCTAPLSSLVWASIYYLWELHIMKLLSTQFSPVSCHLLPLRPQYLPQCRQSTVAALCQTLCTATQHNRQAAFYIFKSSYSWRSKWEDKTFYTKWYRYQAFLAFMLLLFS
jgi:hypothetical protein